VQHLSVALGRGQPSRDNTSYLARYAPYSLDGISGALHSYHTADLCITAAHHAELIAILDAHTGNGPRRASAAPPPPLLVFTYATPFFDQLPIHAVLLDTAVRALEPGNAPATLSPPPLACYRYNVTLGSLLFNYKAVAHLGTTE
jgi:hypothetical protein